MIVACDVCLGVSWIIFGLINRIDKQEDKHRSQLIFYWICITQVFAAATILLNVLQIYNWFSFRRVSLMLAMYFLVDLIGKYIQDAFDKNPFFTDSYIDFIFGVVFVVWGAIDYFTFCFQPAALNVYIDQRQSFLTSSVLDQSSRDGGVHSSSVISDNRYSDGNSFLTRI